MSLIAGPVQSHTNLPRVVSLQQLIGLMHSRRMMDIASAAPERAAAPKAMLRPQAVFPEAPQCPAASVTLDDAMAKVRAAPLEKRAQRALILSFSFVSDSPNPEDPEHSCTRNLRRPRCSCQRLLHKQRHQRSRQHRSRRPAVARFSLSSRNISQKRKYRQAWHPGPSQHLPHD